ncbi:MAG: gliding motility-associated C-terminal domain-containing protein, partial [Bacteroidota bacterium]
GLNTHRIVISPVDGSIHEGTYSVQVTVDDCILQSDTYELDVFDSPSLAPTATAGPLCEGDDLQLQANATNAVSLQWTGPNGFLSNAANPLLPAVSIRNNGTYYLQIVSSSGCIQSASIEIDYIVPTPVQPVITVEDLVCEDAVIRMSIPQVYNGTSISYEWINGQGQVIGSSRNVDISASDPLAISPFQVRVIVDGCASPISDPVSVDIGELPIATATNNGPICLGEQVQLFAGTVNGAAYEWRNASTGALVSTDQNPVVFGLNSSTTYVLTVISNGCLSDPVAQTTVVVNGSPRVNPGQNYVLNSDCAPSDLRLSAGVVLGSSAIVSYQWTGPNGFSSSVENPLIPNASTANNGSYELVVTDENGCIASGVVEVSGISDQIVQPIISSTGPACNGESITLSVPVYNGARVDYRWDVPDQSNISGLNTHQIVISPVDGAIHAGRYSVTVEVDDCTIQSDVYELQIFPQPMAAPTATTGVICEGSQLNLTANATGASSYSWTGPNGFQSTAENPQIANVDLSANGTYSLRVSSVSNCESVYSIVVDNIVAQPVQPQVIARSSVCEDEIIELRILQFYNGSSVDYEWFNGLGTSIGTTRDLDLTTSDARAVPPYYVFVTVDGCAAPASQPVQVEVLPLPLATARNSGPVCMGGSVQLEAGPIPNATYLWYNTNPTASSPPAVAFSTEQRPIVRPAAPGLYTYYLQIETSDGCLSDPMATTVVEVYPEPEISNLSGGGTYCEGSTINLSGINLVPVAGPVSYTWRGPNGFVFTATSGAVGSYPMTLVNANPQMAGAYSLQLTSADGCESNIETIQLFIEPEPTTPVLSVNQDFLCEGEQLQLNAPSYTAANQVIYEWFFDDGSGRISLGTTDVPSFFIDNVNASNDGIYTVSVTVDGCTSSLSNAEDVAIFGRQAPPLTSNNTSASDPACEGGSVTLSVPLILGATYEWFGPNGFTSTQPNPVINNVTAANAGSYYVVIDLNGCASVVSESTIVFVQDQLEVPTIVNSGPVCEGGEITLEVSSPINVPNGIVLRFEWYRVFTNELVATTSEPELTLTNLMAADAGGYYLRLYAGNCEAPLSEQTELQVDVIPPNEADAGLDQEVCATTLVILDAEPPSVGTGIWTSLTGATVSNPDLPNSEVIDLEEGENIFVWSLSNGACENYDADTVVVRVTLVPIDEAFAGNDINICGQNATVLSANPPLVASGVWTQSLAQASLGVEIVDPNSPDTEINGLESGNSYEFVWTLSEGVCVDFASDVVLVTVNEAPLIEAFVETPLLYVCDATTATLSAQAPSIGGGQWLSTSGARIIEPFQAVTAVDGLDKGENVFVWSLSNGTCENYSTDTLIIIREDGPVANAESYLLAFRDSLTGEDLLDNDLIGNASELSIQLIQAPENGTLSDNLEDGVMDYIPNRGFFGEDSFIYELCNVNCPDQCDTALVRIEVMADPNSSDDCWVPNIITPNNDNLNDALTIPCLDNYPNNNIKVFNRWGDKVYESGPYLNDWEGTYRGETLPPGTYFYILQLDPSQKPIQGFFTLNR